MAADWRSDANARKQSCLHRGDQNQLLDEEFPMYQNIFFLHFNRTLEVHCIIYTVILQKILNFIFYCF